MVFFQTVIHLRMHTIISSAIPGSHFPSIICLKPVWRMCIRVFVRGRHSDNLQCIVVLISYHAVCSETKYILIRMTGKQIKILCDFPKNNEFKTNLWVCKKNQKNINFPKGLQGYVDAEKKNAKKIITTFHSIVF